MKLTSAHYWRIGFGIAIAICLAIAALIWRSGTNETANAMNNGQRLLVTLATGTIEGKQAPTENAESKDKAPDAATENAPETPAPTEDSPAPSPEHTADAKSPEPSPTPTPTPTPTPDATAAEEPAKSANPLAPVKESLVEAEKINTELLPTISADGVKPWRNYAKHYEHKGNTPMIAIVVTGLGQNKSTTDMALKLPDNVSLSFSPYAKDFSTWVNAARASGHEVLVDLPLEPTNFPASDPGPHGLLIGSGAQVNTARLEWLMTRGQGYSGFITPQNDAFTSDTEAFKNILNNLGKRGVMIMMGHEPAKGETSELLANSQAAYGIADMLIDEELSTNAIQARLLTLEKLAIKRGYAVGVAQAFPLSMQKLNDWSAHAEKDGVELVPVTTIVGIKFPN